MSRAQRGARLAGLIALASRLSRDVQGTAAVEFGILVPVLMLMLLGAVEAARAVSTNSHFKTAVSTAGDLVAREEFLGTRSSEADDNLKDMMKSIDHLMAPYDASQLKIGIFSVQASASNAADTKVVWSYSPPGHTWPDLPAKCSKYALPDKLIGKGGSTIVVAGEYTFTPLFGSYVPGFGDGMTFKDKSFHSPRNSCVDYVKGDNCLNPC